MDTVNILLIINTILLAIIGMLLSVAGYFFRELHLQFKNLAGKVGTMYGKFQARLEKNKAAHKAQQFQIDNLSGRIKQLEKHN